MPSGRLLKISFVLLVVAGFTGNHQQNNVIVGGPKALQTNHQGVDCICSINEKED